jgi:type II secretory pathway component PulF
VNSQNIMQLDLFGFLRREDAPWRGPIMLRVGRKMRCQELVLGQVRVLIAANAPLKQGLEAAAVDARSAVVRNVFLELRNGIASGRSLSEAMEGMPRFFPKWCVALVRSGEETGRPGESLALVLDEMQARVTSRAIAKINLFYLFALLLFCAQAYHTLQRVLIPLHAEIAASLQTGHANPTSNILLWIRGSMCRIHPDPGREMSILFIREYFHEILVVLAGLIAMSLLIRFMLSHWKAARCFLDTLLAPLPLVGGMRRATALASATHVLAVQLDSGVPADTALGHAGQAAGGTRVGRAFERAAVFVQEGNTLSDALGKGGKCIPAGFRVALALGERAGRPVEVLACYSHRFGAISRTKRKILVDLILPVGVLCMGVLVLLVCQVMFGSMAALVDLMAESI